MGIKVFTKKKNRFGKIIDICGTKVTVDAKGNAEVEENIVPRILITGFELVNPDQKFKSVEQLEASEKVNQIIEDAKKEAERVVKEAQEEADRIIEEAKKEVASLLTSNQVKERRDMIKSLNQLTVEQLKQNLATSKVPEEEYKDLKKAELIDLTIELAFGGDEE